MFGQYLENVRKKNLTIHNITNYVTANDVADIILACGARPIMADEKEEAEEITAISAGLNINLGTLQKRRAEAMILAGRRAKELHHPVLLDPVGVGASRLRMDTAQQIMNEIHPDVIRGNISEIRALFEKNAHSGIDADRSDCVSENSLDEGISFVRQCAGKYGGIIVASGAIDLVSDGTSCYVIRNGKKEMALVSGTGCQLSGLITAFIASNRENLFESVAAAVCLMGVAGEIGAEHMQSYEGNAMYRNRIIDAVYYMNAEMLDRRAEYEMYQR